MESAIIIISPTFHCDEIGCGKPMNKPGLISPLDGRVFCGTICAACDFIRMRLETDPHLVPKDTPLRLQPKGRH
jgi:hypothetical protein